MSNLHMYTTLPFIWCPTTQNALKSGYIPEQINLNQCQTVSGPDHCFHVVFMTYLNPLKLLLTNPPYLTFTGTAVIHFSFCNF